jgi:hypothetical protein
MKNGYCEMQVDTGRSAVRGRDQMPNARCLQPGHLLATVAPTLAAGCPGCTTGGMHDILIEPLKWICGSSE